MKKYPELTRETAAFIEGLEAKNDPPLYTLSYQDARAVLAAAQSGPTPRPEADVTDFEIPFGEGGAVELRIVRPKGGKGRLPVVFYIHGGGWVMGDKNTHDRLVREIAVRTGAAVVFVNYTPSPEAQYPVPLRQIMTALRYIVAHADELKLDAARIAVAGDSVGGNMAAALTLMCKAENVGKVSRRDFAIYVAEGRDGATTVASTMMCCAYAGIQVFATGGIGGVHRHGEVTMDVSADLQELAHTNVAVVCAGAKQILDIGRTLEYLETMGVPVIGNGTSDFPAFYCRKSGYGVDYAAKDEADIAKLIHTKQELGLKGGMLIGNPIPEEYAMDFDYMEEVIQKALVKADEAGVHGKNITPFLLASIKDITGGKAFEANVKLALNNARCAAKIAKALSDME